MGPATGTLRKELLPPLIVALSLKIQLKGSVHSPASLELKAS